MAAQISNLADVPIATELHVTPVEDSSALNEYRQILTAGFGEGPKEVDWVASVFAAIGLEEPTPVVVARLGSMLLAAAAGVVLVAAAVAAGGHADVGSGSTRCCRRAR